MRRTGIGLGVGLALACGGVATAGDAVHGAQVYAAQCGMCHGSAGRGGMGPALTGVIGRRAASTAFAYSPALRRVGWTWDAAKLDRYLSDPQAAAPGTSMPVALKVARDRADVVAYMASLPAAAGKPGKRAAAGVTTSEAGAE